MANSITQPPQQDRRLIDTIAYLASLSSSVQEINPMLDTLRIVTSRWHNDTPLHDADRTALEQLERRLRAYLIHNDALRDFTETSLSERVVQHLEGATYKRTSLNFWHVTGLATIAAITAVALPYTPNLGTRALLSSPAFLLVGLCGVIWFYLSSLANFKRELHRAFVWLCVGTAVLGVFFVHFVVVQILDKGNMELFHYGGLLALATLAVLCMYRGLVLYARLLGHAGACMSPQVFLAAQAGAAALAAAITAIRHVPSPLYFGFAMFCLLSLTTASGFAAMVGRMIYRDASRTYAVSIRWLYIFMAGTFFGSIAYGTSIAVLGYLSGAALSIALACFAIPPVLLLLYSGYSFKKETSR